MRVLRTAGILVAGCGPAGAGCRNALCLTSCEPLGTNHEWPTWRRDFKDFAPLRWPGGCFADEYHWKDGMM